MLREISDRRALGAALVAMWTILLAFSGSYAWLQRRVAQAIDADTHRILQRELALTERVDRTVGRETLVRALKVRTGYADPDYFWAMFDARGEVVVGDVANLPLPLAKLRTVSAATRAPIDDRQDAYIDVVRLADGARVVLGRRDERRSMLARDFAYAALVALGVLLFASTLAVTAFDRYLVRHLRDLSETARRIMRGQMGARATAPERLSERGSLTRAFNEILDHNEALVSGMRTVTESLAHDLRRPLMRVRRGIEAAREASEPADRDAYLAVAEVNAARALQTFNALVDLARAEAGLSRESMERVDVAMLAIDVIELFAPLAEERGQKIVHVMEPCSTIAHRQLLSQALSNLLDNAIKYSPPDSTLTLTVKCLPSGGCELGVEDRGPGIPAHAREQALRPFVRLESGDATGAGMGLAICAAVARLHGGSLELESAEPGLRARMILGPMSEATKG